MSSVDRTAVGLSLRTDNAPGTHPSRWSRPAPPHNPDSNGLADLIEAEMPTEPAQWRAEDNREIPD